MTEEISEILFRFLLRLQRCGLRIPTSDQGIVEFCVGDDVLETGCVFYVGLSVGVWVPVAAPFEAQPKESGFSSSQGTTLLMT